MAETKVIQLVDNMDGLTGALEFMRKNYVLVGIPQKETSREGEPVTNAELLFIHSNGSPINNIPARPVIEPAIMDDSDRLADMLKTAARIYLTGNESGALAQLELTGTQAQNVSRAWFTNPKNNWPENTEAVKEQKRKKNATEPRPLIDTDELRRSIIYVVVNEG